MENFCDPQFLKDLIGKTVQVTTIDNKVHEGQVYTIDPISYTLILYTDSKSVEIVMYDAIKTLNVTVVDGVDEDFFKEDVLSDDDVKTRKCRLKSWLKKNLIDVKDEGSVLKIKDDVIIGPPYTVDQCSCPNVFILERIIALMEKMP